MLTEVFLPDARVTGAVPANAFKALASANLPGARTRPWRLIRGFRPRLRSG